MAESYHGYIHYVLETRLVRCVWETLQQDLVTGRFIPQGEVDLQLVGFQSVHGDVRLPQAACPGHRHKLGVRNRRVCATK